MRCLVVGDGDFSFSLALIRRSWPGSAASTGSKCICLIATSLETADEVSSRPHALENIEALCTSGALVLHGVDGTRLDGHQTLVDLNSKAPTPGFDRIVFNFPHAGGKGNIAKNRCLLEEFFKSAVKFLRSCGEIHVALCKGQGGTQEDCLRRGYANSWKVVEMASLAGLFLSSVEPFMANCYQSYTPTGYRGQAKGFLLNGALNHVFSLPCVSPAITLWRGNAVESCSRCHSVLQSVPAQQLVKRVTADLHGFLGHPLLGQPWQPVVWVCHMLEVAFGELAPGPLWSKVESEICERLVLHCFPSTPPLGNLGESLLDSVVPLTSAPIQKAVTSMTAVGGAPIVTVVNCEPRSAVHQLTMCEILALSEAHQQTSQKSTHTCSMSHTEQPVSPSCPSKMPQLSPATRPSVAGGCVLKLISRPVISSQPASLCQSPILHEMLGVFPLAHLHGLLSSPEALFAELEKTLIEVIERVLVHSGSISSASNWLQRNLSWHQLGSGAVQSRELRVGRQTDSSHGALVATCRAVQLGCTTGDRGDVGKWEAVALTFDLDRLAMLHFGIEDTRLLWSTDARFVAQFSCPDPHGVVFAPFNLSAPAYSHDVSFWCNGRDADISGLSSDTSASPVTAAAPPNSATAPPTSAATLPTATATLPTSVTALTTYAWQEANSKRPFSRQRLAALVWRIAGTTALSLSCMDAYSPPGNSRRLGLCYRVVYQSALRPLSAGEAGQMQLKLRQLMQCELDVVLR